MQLHLVGGFLGSGKTTAIISAARQLMHQGLLVGVITNDQGKYLVDTAFFKLDAIPTVEVAGGCFCCNYDDLDGRLNELITTAHPDVIFAESVGSCTDIIATVVKPLLTLRQGEHAPFSFSVFADARLLRMRLLDLPMPFSDNVVYIFDKQIEETSLLVVNKVDLLKPDNLEELKGLAACRFRGKSLLYQDSLDSTHVNQWLCEIQNGKAPLPTHAVAVDYQRYGDGEAQMAWLDAEMTLSSIKQPARSAIIHFLTSMNRSLNKDNWPVGHLKFLIKYGSTSTKLSFTTLPPLDWETEIPDLSYNTAQITVNARVEMPAEQLYTLLLAAVQQCELEAQAIIRITDSVFFHPKYPNPTHRITN